MQSQSLAHSVCPTARSINDILRTTTMNTDLIEMQTHLDYTLLETDPLHPYGSGDPFSFGGFTYRSIEQYYQCQKYPDSPEIQKLIRECITPQEARQFGKLRVLQPYKDPHWSS